MAGLLQRLIVDVTTIADGKSFCYAKIKGWLSWLVGTGLSVYSTIWQHVPFNIGMYLGAVCALLTGVGAAIFMKKPDEPQGQPPADAS